MHNIEVINMDEMKQLLENAKKMSKALKINKQEALLLIIAHHTGCIHDHIDKIIFGTIQAHAPVKPEKDRR